MSVNCKCGIALERLRFLAYSAMSVPAVKHVPASNHELGQ